MAGWRNIGLSRRVSARALICGPRLAFFRIQLELQARVERVAQPVSEQVRAQHRDHDGQAREDAQPPRRGQAFSALAEHRPPAWYRWLHSHAEEAPEDLTRRWPPLQNLESRKPFATKRTGCALGRPGGHFLIWRSRR